MKHVKLFEDFKANNYHDNSTLGELEIKKTDDTISLLNVRVDQEDAHNSRSAERAGGYKNSLGMSAENWKPEHYDAYDWFEYAMKDKKPMMFGKSKFKADLKKLEDLCKNLKVTSHKPAGKDDWNELKSWNVIMNGKKEDIDAVYSELENMSKTKY